MARLAVDPPKQVGDYELLPWQQVKCSSGKLAFTVFEKFREEGDVLVGKYWVEVVQLVAFAYLVGKLLTRKPNVLR